MTNEKDVLGKSRATTENETFYIQWGYETVKANIGTANEVLKLLITINVALIGGGAAFLYKSDVPEGFRITILSAFFIGLILAFSGVFPRESAVDIRMPNNIKAHKNRVLDSKRSYPWAASTFTVFGLLASAMAVSEVHIFFNKARHSDVYYMAASPPFRSRACWLALESRLLPWRLYANRCS